MAETEIRTLAAQALADIAPEADPASVGDSENQREALDLDSKGFLNFVSALSTKSGLRIP